MKAIVVILVCDTSSWPVLHNCEESWLYSNRFATMEQTRNCSWNHQGEITQKVWKPELSFLYITHCRGLFYITLKYHDYIPKGIQVTEQTQICIKKHQRGDNWKRIKARALIFVCDTLSWPVLHNYEISSKYSKQFSSYRADMKMFMNGWKPGSLLYPPEHFGRGIKMKQLDFIMQ